MDIQYTLTGTTLNIVTPPITSGHSVRVYFTAKHTADSLSAEQQQAVSLLAAAILFEHLASLNLSDHALYNQYTTRAEDLRHQYDVLTGHGDQVQGEVARDIINIFRYLVDDYRADWFNDDSGLLWSNAECIHFLDQALQQFTSRLPIPDEITLYLQQDVSSYNIPPETIEIKRCRIDNVMLKKTFLSAVSVGEWTQTGHPIRYGMDNVPGKVLFFPVPDQQYTVNAHITRRAKPVTSIFSKCEINRAEANVLIYYMAHLAYLKQDAETADLQRSQAMLAVFDTKVGRPVNLTEERDDTFYREALTMRVE